MSLSTVALERFVIERIYDVPVAQTFLATSVSAVIAIVLAARGQWSALLAAGAVLLLSAEAAWLLRRAARDLVRKWARAWGWKVVR